MQIGKMARFFFPFESQSHAVEMHCAGAALREAAAKMRIAEPELVAQHV